MTKILKNKGFYEDGKKYHKIILKKVLTLVKNGGKLMPSSRGLTSELNIKTIWFLMPILFEKLIKKFFEKILKKVLTNKKTYCIIQIVHREGEQKVHWKVNSKSFRE